MLPMKDGDSMCTEESLDAQPLLGSLTECRIGGDVSLYHTKLLSGICPSRDVLIEQDPVWIDQDQVVSNQNQDVQYSETDCVLKTGDGVCIGINVHTVVLRRVLPVLSDISTGRSSCVCEKLVIIMPETNVTIINKFIELVYRGCCRIQNKSEEKNLRDLLTNLGIDWNLSSSCPKSEFIGPIEGFEDDDNCTGNIIGQCYDEGEDDVSVASFYDCVESEVEFKDSFAKSPIKFQAQDCKKEDFCSKFCSNQCQKALEQWTPQSITQLRSLFKSGEGITETRNNLIKHLWSQSRIGVPTDTYIVNNHAFCLKFFASVTDISEFIVKSVLVDFLGGQSLYKHGKSGNLKHQTTATTGFICWMKLFAETYGQFAPDINQTVLSYWLNKQYLFTLYQDETEGPHLSQSAFYQNFKTYFSFTRTDKSLPHIIISKYSSHSVCNQCVALAVNRRQCKTEAEFKHATDLSNQHKVIFGEARRKIQEIKQSALLFPTDNLFIQVQIFK